MNRTRTLTGAGVIATVVLVLLFGNQAVTEWVSRHYPNENSDGWSWLLHKLTWPAWAFSPSSAGPRALLVQDLRALFLILFVALILSLVARGVSGGAFFIGWAALIFASALAALITAWVAQDASLIGSLQAAQQGSGYGLFVGWIVGIATATAKKPTP